VTLPHFLRNKAAWGYLWTIGFIAISSFLGLVLAERHDVGESAYAEALNRFDKMRAIAALKPELDKQNNAAPLDSERRLDFLSAGTSASNSADLGAKIKVFADAHSVQVLRSENVDVKSDLDIAQDVQLSGTNKNVTEFLQEFSNSHPALFLERLVISNPNASLPDQANEFPLNVEIRVDAMRTHVASTTK